MCQCDYCGDYLGSAQSKEHNGNVHKMTVWSTTGGCYVNKYLCTKCYDAFMKEAKHGKGKESDDET